MYRGDPEERPTVHSTGDLEWTRASGGMTSRRSSQGAAGVYSGAVSPKGETGRMIGLPPDAKKRGLSLSEDTNEGGSSDGLVSSLASSLSMCQSKDLSPLTQATSNASSTHRAESSEEDAADEPRGCKGLTMQQLRRRLAVLSKEQLLELAAFGMFNCQTALDAGDALLDSDPASRRVMVRGLWYCTTDWTFCKYFSTFGELENAAVIRHPDGRSQGYGFLIYTDRHAAEAVVSRRHYLDDRLVTAKLAADQYTEFSRDADGKKIPSERRKLFVRNICHVMTKETLEREFSVYGPIEECAVIRTTDKAARGYGFVTFCNAADALRAAQIPFRVIQGWVVFVTFSTGKGRQQQMPTPPGSGRKAMSATLIIPQRQQQDLGTRTTSASSPIIPGGTSRASREDVNACPAASTSSSSSSAASAGTPPWAMMRPPPVLPSPRRPAVPPLLTDQRPWQPPPPPPPPKIDPTLFPQDGPWARRFSAPTVPAFAPPPLSTSPRFGTNHADDHGGAGATLRRTSIDGSPYRPISSPFDIDSFLLRSVVEALDDPE